MVTLTPLFSGSKGNSTLIQTPSSKILLDAGFSYRAIVSRLAALQVNPLDISAIVVTHEHGDHISALKVWSKNFGTKVYVPKGCGTYIAQSCFCSNLQEVNGTFCINGVTVDIYNCSHDSRNCFGYRFTEQGESVASVTDTGTASISLADFLSPCKTVMLESNHDVQMLWNGNYSYHLKQRIASDFGHLSNNQAAQILEMLLGSSVKNVVLAHLSEQNNTKSLAMSTAVEMYGKHGVEVGKDIFVYVADQNKNEVTL